jgi:hypothetical protein
VAIWTIRRFDLRFVDNVALKKFLSFKFDIFKYQVRLHLWTVGLKEPACWLLMNLALFSEGKKPYLMITTAVFVG